MTAQSISPVRMGQSPITLFDGTHGFSRFPPFPAPVQIPTGGLHSLSVSNDGTRAFYALLTGGFGIATSKDGRLVAHASREDARTGKELHSFAAKDGMVYVADAFNNRLQVFDENGQPIPLLRMEESEEEETAHVRYRMDAAAPVRGTVGTFRTGSSSSTSSRAARTARPGGATSRTLMRGELAGRCLGVVTAAFDLLTGGVATSTVTFSAVGQIFGTETPAPVMLAPVGVQCRQFRQHLRHLRGDVRLPPLLGDALPAQPRSTPRPRSSRRG